MWVRRAASGMGSQWAGFGGGHQRRSHRNRKQEPIALSALIMTLISQIKSGTTSIAGGYQLNALKVLLQPPNCKCPLLRGPTPTGLCCLGWPGPGGWPGPCRCVRSAPMCPLVPPHARTARHPPQKWNPLGATPVFRRRNRGGSSSVGILPAN